MKRATLKISCLLLLLPVFTNSSAQHWKNLGLPGNQVSAITGDSVNIYAAGGFSIGQGIARWDGTSWHSLGSTNPSNYSTALAVYNGNICVGGKAGNCNGNNYVASISDTTWNCLGDFGTSAVSTINSLCVYDTLLVAAGTFDSVNGIAAHNIAAWNGTSWLAIGDLGNYGG